MNVEEDPSFVPDLYDTIASDASSLTLEHADLVNERKFVICESQLDKLLSKMFCPECAENDLSTTKNASGTNISIKIRCSNGHVVMDWSSQQQVGKMFSFNLLLCSSIVFSGKLFEMN